MSASTPLHPVFAPLRLKPQTPCSNAVSGKAQEHERFLKPLDQLPHATEVQLFLE